VEYDYTIDPKNPTMAQIKMQKKKKDKEGKSEVMFVCWCFTSLES